VGCLDLFEFEKACRLLGCSILYHCAFYTRSYTPFWCDMCNSSFHNITSWPYYACYAQPDFSSPRDNTDVVLNLPDLSLPLAQCTGFKGGEPLGYDARLNGISECLESEDAFYVVQNLVDTPLDGSRDMFVHEGSPSLGCDHVIPILHENSYVSLTCSQSSFPWSILLMCPMIFLNFVILMLIWVMRITCLICLVGMLKILSP